MRSWKNLTLILLLVILFLIPVGIKNEYYLHILIICGINILLASSLRAMMASGQASLGHTGFMSVGAYVAGILIVKTGFLTLPAILIGGIAAMLLAAIIAYPITRVKTLYFVMITMFLSQAVLQILTEARNITGGTSGLLNIAHLSSFNILGYTIDFSAEIPNYYFILVLGLIILFLLYRLDRSYIGMTLYAISQDESLAASAGINVAKYKSLIFCIGCFVAGVAGGFYASYITILTPDSFNLLSSIYVLIYVIVGGSQNFYGAIIGAFIFTLVPEVFRPLKEYQPLIFAGAMYLVVFLLPGGLVTLPGVLHFRIKREIKANARN